MPRIDFYYDAPDRLAIALRLVHKAFEQGLSIMICCPDEGVAEAVDRHLWIHPATGFLPHCRSRSPLAPETPIVIGPNPEESPHHSLLINLGSEPPPGFERFDRIVEIVGQDEAEKAPGRVRYKFYLDQKQEIHRHDMGAARSPT